MKLGIGSAVALATPQIMTRAAHAQVPMPDVGNAGFHRFMLGDFEITTIHDGGRAGDGPHPTFGEDQPAEDVAELMEENFLPTDRFVNGFTPTLVNTGAELVLFDTGLGPGARDGGMGQLRSRLEASGYAPEDVGLVVITHMHPDHIGGLREGEEWAFPNARYATGQVEFDHWIEDGTSQNEGIENNVVPLADDMAMLSDGDEVVPGITGMLAAGHTPGHMVFMIESGDRQLLLTADTANHYIASLRRPDWHVSFDMDKEQAAETRKRVFDMLASERLPFVGYHMPFPAVGFVEKLDTGYRYIPATYQFDV